MMVVLMVLSVLAFLCVHVALDTRKLGALVSCHPSRYLKAFRRDEWQEEEEEEETPVSAPTPLPAEALSSANASLDHKCHTRLWRVHCGHCLLLSTSTFLDSSVDKRAETLPSKQQ